RRRHTRFSRDWSSDVCSSDLVSWSQLGSDGAWQSWLAAEELEPFQPSNAGVEYVWSRFMQPVFGQPLKRVAAWVGQGDKSTGDKIGRAACRERGGRGGRDEAV